MFDQFVKKSTNLMKKLSFKFFSTLLGVLMLAGLQAQVNVNHPISGSSSFTIAPPGTCSFNYYDNGGPAGNYANGVSNSSVTFNPSTNANRIRATFSAYATESSFDYLYIHNGPTTGSPIIATGNGGNFAGQQFTSTDASGALTFRFFSDFSVSQAGWIASIAQVPVSGCQITAPAPVSVSTGPLVCAADINVPTPAFNPTGCAAAYTLRYAIN